MAVIVIVGRCFTVVTNAVTTVNDWRPAVTSSAIAILQEILSGRLMHSRNSKTKTRSSCKNINPSCILLEKFGWLNQVYPLYLFYHIYYTKYINYITRCSLSSTKYITSPENWITYLCQKICSLTQRPWTVLEIIEKIIFLMVMNKPFI